MTMRPETLKFLNNLAERSGWDSQELRFDASDYGDNERTVLVTVYWEFAVDEEFYMDELFAVNVVDELANLVAKQSHEDPDRPDWSISVTKDCGDHGETIYEILGSQHEWTPPSYRTFLVVVATDGGTIPSDQTHEWFAESMARERVMFFTATEGITEYAYNAGADPSSW